MKFSIKDFFSKCDQIRSKLRATILKEMIYLNYLVELFFL